MMHAKALTNHQAGAGGGDNVTFCLSYQEAAAAVAAGKTTAQQVARRHLRMAAFKRSGKLGDNGAEPVKVMTCSGANAATSTWAA